MLEVIHKTISTLQRQGLKKTAQKVAGKLLFGGDPVSARKLEIATQVDQLLHSTVAYGPFKGLKFSEESWWNRSDRAGMLLGLYEQEVLTSLMTVPPIYRTFIHLGAADGYYAIGVLISRLCDASICFELSERGRRTILRNAELNGVASRVTINGIAERRFFAQIPREHHSRSILFVDIEGAEFEIFDAETFHKFRDCIMFMELHDHFFESGAQKLAQLREDACRYFRITELTTTSRDLSGFIELKPFNDTDRWLICSEGRRATPHWYRLDPVDSSAG